MYFGKSLPIKMFSIGIISPIPNNSNIAAITVRIKI